MVIFDKFLRQKLIKIYAKTHQIAPFYKIFSGQHDPKPPSTSVKNLTTPPPPTKSWLRPSNTCIYQVDS